MDRHGRVDGLVINAGASFHVRLEEIDPVAYLELLNLNVVSAVTALQAVLPVMRKQHFGRIVAVSSDTTRVAPPGAAGYAASKAAMNMLAEVARKDFADDGIEVSLVLPSVTATEFAGGRLLPGAPAAASALRPGMVLHSAEYVGRVILRALRTGEQRIDIPHGPELPELTEPAP